MDYMEQSLALARQALGKVGPIPAVGAVLVRDNQVVGEGFTRPPGGPHAEIVALEQAGSLARDATLYVTLEPCCHYGRTPPCTDALLNAGVAEVHIGTLDPYHLVAGQGKNQLEEAGVHVVVGECEREARQINEPYFKFTATGTPLITAKFAASLDGKIATRTGDSRWITGEEARQRGHQFRATSDAIMTGIGTVLVDDPLLTARPDGQLMKHQPLRIVVDSTARLSPNARLFQNGGPVLVAVANAAATKRRALHSVGAEVIIVPAKDGRVDLVGLIKSLGGRGVTSVLVEGGGKLIGSLFDQRLVDKVVAFIAPKLVGGNDAPTAVGGLGHTRVADAPTLRGLAIERVGEDFLVTGYPVY